MRTWLLDGQPCTRSPFICCPRWGCLTRFTLTLSGCAWALKARITIRCRPNSIWVAAQNHGRMTAISLIEPLNFAAITSCANVVQLQCCVVPARPLLREQQTRKPCLMMARPGSASVTGFGCRPHHGALHTREGGRAGVRKPPGKETAGEWAPLSGGAMEIWLAATVQRGSGRETAVLRAGARQRRVGALRASTEQMVW